MTVKQIQASVVKIIHKYLGSSAEVYLFGSQAKGDARPTSDIDIAVEISDKDIEKYHRIKQEVDELRTLRKIDVVNLALVSEKFKKHIFKYAIPL